MQSAESSAAQAAAKDWEKHSPRARPEQSALKLDAKSFAEFWVDYLAARRQEVPVPGTSGSVKRGDEGEYFSYSPYAAEQWSRLRLVLTNLECVVKILLQLFTTGARECE